MLEYQSCYTSIDEYTTQKSSEYKRSRTSVVTNTWTLHVQSLSVSTACTAWCTPFPMTYSALQQIFLGSEACEKEREREGGGGGLKGLAHFTLQILVIFFNVHRFFIGKRKQCPTRYGVLTFPPTCVPHVQSELVRHWFTAQFAMHAQDLRVLGYAKALGIKKVEETEVEQKVWFGARHDNWPIGSARGKLL